MDRVEALLHLLDNGEWHAIANLARRLGWTTTETRELVQSLDEYGLVEYRSSDDRVRSDPELRSMRVGS